MATTQFSSHFFLNYGEDDKVPDFPDKPESYELQLTKEGLKLLSNNRPTYLENCLNKLFGK